ncbi:hypothetical protein EDM54_11260 [Brevibacillus borstelensis]|nr:hypothetical protein X546_00505 [Brevibacillus borstelensis cifa_chp40]RNB63108.1 hypothetical protein EDM54_11260 [Brevibacillus borstelensis]
MSLYFRRYREAPIPGRKGACYFALPDRKGVYICWKILACGRTICISFTAKDWGGIRKQETGNKKQETSNQQPATSNQLSLGRLYACRFTSFLT